jgi:hypothetical protein
MKVLPHWLDSKGRHSLTPSLFDRDAYQAFLREHPAQRSTIRFDVQWKLKGASTAPLKLRVEARGVARGSLPATFVLEKDLKARGRFSNWAAVTLPDKDYQNLGDITSWRVTLLEGTIVLSEQQSFLW